MKRFVAPLSFLVSFSLLSCVKLQENCGNNVDDDGDGVIDCGDQDCSDEPSCQPIPEVCNNGLDDDLDGNVDCQDSDCSIAINCQIDNCGNGALDAGEQCDGGNLNGASCADFNFNAGSLACSASCSFNTSGCFNIAEPFCGDDVIDAGEECDGLNLNGITCTDRGFTGGILACAAGTCLFDESGCNNFGPEVCNDGLDNDNDGQIDCADVECLADPVCQTGPVCGDGAIQNGEVCDDGNTTNGDCCSSTCQTEAGCEIEVNNTPQTANDLGTPPAVIKGSAVPASDFDFFRFTVPATADVRIETFDGNPAQNSCSAIDTTLRLFATDGTTQLASDADDGIASCSLLNPLAPQNDVAVQAMVPGVYFAQVTEAGQNAEIPLYQLKITFLALCGNNQVEGGEACDDGNTNSGDGCRNDCRLVEPICGDSVTTAPEQCDDGNQNNGDACKNDCTNNVCGDGIVLVGTEDCDDGNTTAGDGCDATCQQESPCGNGIIDAGENCDDGDTISGDCCSSSCRSEGFCEIENNNANAGANKLVNDTFIAGNVFPGGDVDTYSFTIGGASQSFISATILPGLDACGTSTVPGIDSVIDLIAPDGTTVLATNDDINATTNRCSAISNTGPHAPGTYFLRVRGFQQLTFHYQLLVDVETNDTEPNGSSAVADQLRTRDIKNNDNTDLGTAAITANPDDVDFYSITVPSGSVITAETVAFGTAICAPGANGVIDTGEIDSVVEIRDTNGTTILVSDDDGGDGFCSKATSASLLAGTYFIVVHDSPFQPANHSFTYNLNVVVTTSERESNNTTALADPIFDEVSANISPAADQDFFRVTVNNNSFISAETLDGTDPCGTSQNPAPAGIDSILELRDTNGTTVLATNDDISSIDNRCSRINTIGPLPAGNYFLHVTPFLSTDTFNYNLRVMVIEKQ